MKCRIWGRGRAREGEGGHGEGVRGRGSARGGERVSCEKDRESEVASHFNDRGLTPTCDQSDRRLTPVEPVRPELKSKVLTRGFVV